MTVVDNKLLREELVNYVENYPEPMSDILVKMFYRISAHVARIRFDWVNFADETDLVQEGVVRCFNYIHKFKSNYINNEDIEVKGNAFAYTYSVCASGMLQWLRHEARFNRDKHTNALMKSQEMLTLGNASEDQAALEKLGDPAEAQKYIDFLKNKKESVGWRPKNPGRPKKVKV